MPRPIRWLFPTSRGRRMIGSKATLAGCLSRSATLVGASLLGGCATLFLGTPPGGLYLLAEADGRPVPAARPVPPGVCAALPQSGRLDIDPLARRFDLALDRRDSCTGRVSRDTATGSYLRDGDQLTLVSVGGEPRWTGYASGAGAITLDFRGDRLLFRRPPEGARDVRDQRLSSGWRDGQGQVRPVVLAAG